MTAVGGASGPRCIDLRALGEADAPALAARIRAARLVCFPTDTVYGMGGALAPAVAKALVAAKGRDPGKPLQVVFPSPAAFVRAVEPSPTLRRACLRLLPGPLTIVLAYPGGWTCPAPGTSSRPDTAARSSPVREAASGRRGEASATARRRAQRRPATGTRPAAASPGPALWPRPAPWRRLARARRPCRR